MKILCESEAFTVEHLGCRFSCRLQGQGAPVLFIQGVGVHGNGWLPQVEELAASYSCLTFDNRGMGRSQPVGGAPIRVEQMAEDALAIMDSKGWSSAHIIGHSLGGLIAQHIALSARHRVRSLALLCTLSRGREATRLSASLLWTGLRTRVGTRRQRRRAFLELVMPGRVGSEDLDALAERLAPIFGHDLADQPPITMRQLRALRCYDATPRLSELTGIATLVLSASQDRIAPSDGGRALAAGVPGARFHELKHAGHGVPILRPAEVNALLLEHLARCESIAASGMPGTVP